MPNSAARGDTANTYRVYNSQAFTHVRLNIYPDGGVARLRVLGSAVPDPRVLGDRIDLAAIHHGGDIAECSDMFYSDARHVLYPGIARTMADGWETARRRTAGNDYLVVTLAGPARLSFRDRRHRVLPGQRARPGADLGQVRPTTSPGTRSSPSARCRRIRGTGSGCRTTRR